MSTRTVLAFAGDVLIARGELARVALAVRDSDAHGRGEPVLLLDAATGRPFDIDLSGTREAVAARHGDPGDTGEDPATEATPAVRRRGRPRLGVVGREVTLLPRHWAWLEAQRGGASATLRRLVDEARRADASGEVRRAARDRTQHLMTALAGDRPGFEEASRALYAGDAARFERETAAWPGDVRAVVRELAADAFTPPGAAAD